MPITDTELSFDPAQIRGVDSEKILYDGSRHEKQRFAQEVDKEVFASTSVPQVLHMRASTIIPTPGIASHRASGCQWSSRVYVDVDRASS